MEKRILLIKEFGNNIFTRNTISSFIDKVEKSKENELVLDFKEIDFISRSCADEYIKRKKESKKIFIEANMSKDVCSMFKLVENQYKDAGVSFIVISDRCDLVKV
jgi:hypothetical protein